MTRQLPETGFLRLNQIIGDLTNPALIPVGKSTWWAGVKAGHYPQPIRTLGKRITAWRVEDIRTFIENSNLHDSQNPTLPPCRHERKP